MTSIADLPDPRVWPEASAAPDAAARLHAAAGEAIGAETGREADVSDARAMRLLEALIADGDGGALADAFESAPSLAIARYLWRLLATIERGESARSTALHTVLFALPIAIVAGLDAREGRARLPAVLGDPDALARLLREAEALGGARTFALAPGLVAADALDVAALPRLFVRRPRDAGNPTFAPVDLPPAPIDVQPGSERVHLRFVAGVVLAAPGTDPLTATSIARWGIPFARALARDLRVDGVSLLALPREPQRLVPALQTGRAVQREVSAQLFASNAIRKLRASVGEPTAVLSAHRAAGVRGGGELRLSLSSPFAPRDAEGLRCPLYPYEGVHEAAAMLSGLMHDCRVLDFHVRGGVHDDVDPKTGGPLLFMDAGNGAAAPLH